MLETAKEAGVPVAEIGKVGGEERRLSAVSLQLLHEAGEHALNFGSAQVEVLIGIGPEDC